MAFKPIKNTRVLKSPKTGKFLFPIYLWDESEPRDPQELEKGTITLDFLDKLEQLIKKNKLTPITAKNIPGVLLEVKGECIFHIPEDFLDTINSGYTPPKEFIETVESIYADEIQ